MTTQRPVLTPAEQRALQMLSLLGEDVVLSEVSAAFTRHSRHCKARGRKLSRAFGVLERTARFAAMRGQPRTDPDYRSLIDEPEGMPILLATYGQAADVLAVSERTVRRLVSGGELPSIRVGGSARIRRADLEAYVAQQEAT